MIPWHQQALYDIKHHQRDKPKFAYGEHIMARGLNLNVPVVIEGLFYNNHLSCWVYSISFPEYPSAKPLELIETGLFRSKAQMRKRMRVV